MLFSDALLDFGFGTGVLRLQFLLVLDSTNDDRKSDFLLGISPHMRPFGLVEGLCTCHIIDL